MPSEDNDRQFEQELRSFAPLDVAPLPKRANVARRRWVGVAVAAAVLLTIGMGLLWRSPDIVYRPIASKETISASQMTLGESQAVLLRAPSFDAAINQLEREERLKEKKATQGRRSAFEVLGREGL